MTHIENDPKARRRHLLSDQQIASHAGISADGLAGRHRQGNGVRIHTRYIVIVSLVALTLLVGAIALASAQM